MKRQVFVGTVASIAEGVYHPRLTVNGSSAITHAAWMFFKVYFLKRGFQGGLVVAVYSATKSFFKYAKLLELQRYGDRG